jgi:hypothetical protein
MFLALQLCSRQPEFSKGKQNEHLEKAVLPAQTCFCSIHDKNRNFELACSVKIVRLLRTCKQLR